MLETPLAFFIFKRPDTTERVFNEIRKVQPRNLMVIADGPRPDRKGESESCAAARKVVEAIDWPCNLLTNYSDLNLGCRNRLASGLDWVFDQFEEAIILEDDCLPHPDFFPYCEELLARYRNDERIGQISGGNFQFGRRRTEYSYYFSRHACVWGWASWRRVWKDYSVKMPLWPSIRDEKWLSDILRDKVLVKYWTKIFERVYQEKQDTWDYQLVFSHWIHGRLAILPNVNLITNIGVGKDATHYDPSSRVVNLPTMPLGLPLVHPPCIIRDAELDEWYDKIYLPPPWMVKQFRSVFKRIRRKKALSEL